MRDISASNITQAVQASWQATPDKRLKYLLQTLAPYLHDYIREVRLTHSEWLSALKFLYGAGRISDENRNEFALISDVFGVTSLVDLLNAAPGATIGSVLGPFYSEDSPDVPVGADLIKNNTGDSVLVTGIVRGIDGNALMGATIDMWQTDAAGMYATQDPRQSHDNLRCKQTCSSDGRYGFTTVLPAPYSIPMDGPVGGLFRETERSQWRPAHYHFIVRAPQHRPIVTELFFSHDKYVAIDAVFGVRERLIQTIKPASAAMPIIALERKADFLLEFDFTLVPSDSVAA